MATTLVANDFRALRNVGLEIPEDHNVALVLGPNGAGKSSIAAAIEYALTGACEWTTAGGAKSGRLVRYGAERADIALSMGDLQVTRTINPGDASNALSVNGYPGKKGAAALELALPFPRDLLRCLLRSDGFVGLEKANEQKAILVQLAGQSVDTDWVKQHLTADEIAALGASLSVQLQGAELLENLKEAAENMRREAGRVKDELEAKARPDGETESAKPLPQDAVAQLNASLQTLDEQIAAAQRAIGAAETDARDRQRAQADHTTANSTADKLTAQRNALGEIPTAPSVDIEQLRAGLEAALEDAKIAGENRAAAAGQIAGLQSGLNAFRTLGGNCVMGGVECPLSVEQRQGAIGAAETQLQGLQAELEAYAAHADQHTAYAQALRQQIQAAETATAAVQTWTERAAALDAQIAEAGKQAEEAAQRYRELEAVDTTRMEAELAELQEERRAVDAQIAADAAAKRDAGTRKGAILAAQQAHDRWQLLEDLVNKLKPSGIPARAMEATVGTVLDAINDVLFTFAPFEVSLDEEDGLRVSYLSGDEARQDATVPAKLLSESEKLRVGTAIQVAFARLKGFPLIVVDAADRLDGQNRKPHLDMLLASGVQAIVTAVPLGGSRPNMPGLVVYDLVDGELVQVQQAQEVAA